MELPSDLKKQRLSATEKKDKDGYFNNTRLEKLYSDFRSREDNDFWKDCTIEGYEYMETDKFSPHKPARHHTIKRYLQVNG